MMETRIVEKRQRKIKENQAEEMRAQQQVEEECQQCLQEKKRHAEEQKKEEELQKQKEEETRKTMATAEAAAMAQVVSPGKSGQQDRADPGINNHLVSMMQGGMEVETSEEGKRDGSQSPLRTNRRKHMLRPQPRPLQR
jgi:hypothetical protein